MFNLSALFVPGVLFAALGAQAPVHADFDHLMQVGIKALSSQNYQEARENLEKAVQENPADATAWTLLGRSLMGEADLMPVSNEDEWAEVEPVYLDAEEKLRKAIEIDDSVPGLWTDLGRVLMREGNVGEAIATFYHALSRGDASLQLKVDLADALLAAHQQAEKVLNWSEAESRLTEAQTVLAQAQQQLILHADVARLQGEVARRQGSPQEAVEHFRRAIHLRPDDDTLHETHLKAVEEGSRDFQNAIRFYEGLVQDKARASWYAGRAHRVKGHYDFNANQDYAQAVEEYATAEKELFTSRRIEPDFDRSVEYWIPRLRAYRGYALMRQGKLEEAEAAFQSALDRNPDLPNAQNGLKELMGEYYGRAGGDNAPPTKFDDLRAYAARVCVVSPNDADSWNNYGFFAREAHRYDESYQAYRRAMTLAPDNPRIINDTALLLVYHLKRDLDLAESWLLEARDIAFENWNSPESSVPEEESQECYGDSIVNLMVLYYRQDNLARANNMYDFLAEELPDRMELRMWRKRLGRPAPAAEKDAAKDDPHGQSGATADETGAGAVEESSASDG